MNKYEVFTIVVLVALFTAAISFLAGSQLARLQCEGESYKLQSEIAGRYMQIIGAPVTLEEQQRYEFVVYGEVEETE